MDIREIQGKDNLQMAAIVRQNLEASNLAIPGTAYFDKELDNLSGYYQKLERAAYWVLVNDENQVLGGVGVAPYPEETSSEESSPHTNTAELQKLYLCESVKGQGLGEKLLIQALDFAKKHYTYLYLETFASLNAANHLYLKHGFVKLNQPVGASEHSACDTWFMKNLEK